MNLHRHILTIVCFGMLFIPMQNYAQRNLEKGNRLFDLNQYEKAIPYFEKDMKAGSREVKLEATYRLADCYRLIGDFENAEKIYKKLIKRGGPESLYKYGLALKAAAKYAEAKKVFEKYVKKQPDDPKGKKMVASCDFAQEMLDAERTYDVRELKQINTKNVEISPVFYQGGIVFSSQRAGGIRPFVSLDGGSTEVLLDLYYMNFDGSEASLENKAYFFPGLNTAMHEGPATFTENGKTVYYTSTVKGKRLSDSADVVQSTLQIFTSSLQGDSLWSKAKSAFEFNSFEYSVLHPTVSSDGKKLIFASNMPGGFGGLDLYIVYQKKDGSWSTPYNLGPEINTSQNELFPFYNNHGKIYFSSNGHPGMGKLDVFQAVYDLDYGWTAVQNMRVPVNSIGDDICFIEQGSTGRGLFVSDRINGTGKDDIYAFTKIQPFEVEIDHERIWVKDNSAFDALTYSIKKEGEKGSLEMTLKEGYWTFVPEADVQYRLTARKDGFSYNKVLVTFTENKDGNKEFQIKPKKGEVAVKLYAGSVKPMIVDSLDTLNTLPPALNIEPKEKLLTKIKRMLMGSTTQEYKLAEMVDYAPVKVHDNLNPNAGLTVKHAVGKRTIKKEVTDENGTASFVALNKKMNVITLLKNPESTKAVIQYDEIKIEEVTLQQTEEEKELVKIIVNVTSVSKGVSKAPVVIYEGDSIVAQGTTNSKGLFEAEVLEKTDYVVSVTKEGYFQSNTNVSVLPAIRNAGMNRVEVGLAKIVEDVAVTVPNIYYESGKWEISPSSKIELDRLVIFMQQNPQIKVLQIFSHTDNVGDEKYNMQLSQKRANSVKKYLIAQGVSTTRLESKGMGETDLLVNDAVTEEDHAQNRRTEFKVVLK